MTEPEQASPEFTPTELKKAMKAFKKRLKLTALDEDSRLGRGPFSAGAQGVVGITPPNQFPQAVWDELVRQHKLRSAGHGLYELYREF
jgi:hypothetical protein